jgi:hypothetical protein
MCRREIPAPNEASSQRKPHQGCEKKPDKPMLLHATPNLRFPPTIPLRVPLPQGTPERTWLRTCRGSTSICRRPKPTARRPDGQSVRPHQPRPDRMPHVAIPFFAQRVGTLDVKIEKVRRDAPRGIATHGLHSSSSQVSPIRLCPKLRCGSVATSLNPAS